MNRSLFRSSNKIPRRPEVAFTGEKNTKAPLSLGGLMQPLVLANKNWFSPLLRVLLSMSLFIKIGISNISADLVRPLYPSYLISLHWHPVEHLCNHHHCYGNQHRSSRSVIVHVVHLDSNIAYVLDKYFRGRGELMFINSRISIFNIVQQTFY